MSDLRDLYQEVVLDHGKNPRNFREMADATSSLVGHNPLCGDRITLYLKLDGDTVTDISFQGTGCAISTASASLLTETMTGKSKAEVRKAFTNFHNMLTGKTDEVDQSALGKLAVFAGVCEFPVRVKCATLAWHTLNGALEGDGEPVSTE